jgi:hypothetical protein
LSLHRATSFAAAVMAVLMLVASGGFHELLHADERGAVVEMMAKPPSMALGGADSVSKQAPSKQAPSEKRPVHGCTGHCAAHNFATPPLAAVLPVRAVLRTPWIKEAAASTPRYASSGPERPPRA